MITYTYIYTYTYTIELEITKNVKYQKMFKIHLGSNLIELLYGRNSGKLKVKVQTNMDKNIQNSFRVIKAERWAKIRL